MSNSFHWLRDYFVLLKSQQDLSVISVLQNKVLFIWDAILAFQQQGKR